MSQRSQTGTLKDAHAVTEALSELGLLLLSDPKRKNAIELVTGQFPRGSWWSHPRSREIYRILQSVEEHPDVVLVKLVDGKVTLVHRALWPALLAVATAREPWQTLGLPEVAARWLAAFDQAQAAGGPVPPVSRTISKEIESRLLAFAESVHTPTGQHETKLDFWSSWAARVGQPLPVGPDAATIAGAKDALEIAATRLGPPPARFPWPTATG